MSDSNQNQQKKIFIACPIGADDSSERARSDKLLKYVIYPAVQELGLNPDEVVIRADKMAEPGRITTQILRELAEADVVVADVTGTNPNVMYEFGIRQALTRPFVLMCEKGHHLPFDLNDLRTVFYTLDLEHFEQAQAELKAHLEKALSGLVSPVDQALFGAARGTQQSGSDSQAGQSLLAVMEVCETILHETQDMKSLVHAVGNIALGLQETKESQEKAQQERMQQEMGMWMMQQLFQNPEGAEKIVPVMEALSHFGKAEEQRQVPPLEEPPSPASPPTNRATRRKQKP